MAQDRTTATALTVVVSAIRGELASWPDSWCMLTDGTPPSETPADGDAAAAVPGGGVEVPEVTEIKEKDEVVVIGDDDAAKPEEVRSCCCAQWDSSVRTCPVSPPHNLIPYPNSHQTDGSWSVLFVYSV